MTRKDYKLIAATLKAQKPEQTTFYNTDTDAEEYAARARYNQWRETCSRFGEELRQTNELFDVRQFLSACGYFE